MGQGTESCWGYEVESYDLPMIRHPCKRKTPKPNKSKQFFGSGSLAMICHCGTEYEAKKADLRRGWGLSCSKHCAAVRRDYGKKAAKVKS